MLTQSLRELEQSHLVKRKSDDSIPPRAEYSLSERGKTLIPILKQIHEDARKDLEKLKDRIDRINTYHPEQNHGLINMGEGWSLDRSLAKGAKGPKIG